MKDAIAMLHRIGEDVIALADCLEKMNGTAEKPPEAEGQATAAEEKPIRLEDVRTILAEISRSGKTAEMKALLGKFGAAKLSDVDPKDYAELLKAAKEVADA